MTELELEASMQANDAMPAAVPGSGRDSFSRTLRVIGALLVVLSASTFMFQHWDHQSDVVRYFMLLGQTVTLAAMGLFLGLRLQAVRSARTLLGLVLACTPVHFTVLGALLYSRTGAAEAGLPAQAVWAAPSLGVALLSTAIALVVLVPVGFLSLRVFSREHAAPLGLAFLGMNAALLLPVREPTLIGLLVLAMTVIFLTIDRKFDRAHALRTFEGRLCRALCFVPVCVMAGRTLLFYEPTQVFVGATWLAAAWTWFWCCSQDNQAHTLVLRRLVVIPVGVAAGMLTDIIVPNEAWSCVCFAALYATMLWPMARRATDGPEFYNVVAGYVACVALLIGTVAFNTTAVSLSLLGGVVMIVVAAWLQRLGLLLSAAGVTILSAILEAWLVIDLVALRHWVTLAAAGLLLIFGAALIERHGPRLTQRMRVVRQELEAWGW